MCIRDRDGRAGDLDALTRESRSYKWLRHTIELLSEGDSPEEFLEHTRLEMFHDQVFCFTPKGRLIALPRGATPIDLAYAVHTDIGNSASGALINGRQMPLTNVLRNGDEVQVLTSRGQTTLKVGRRRCMVDAQHQVTHLRRAGGCRDQLHILDELSFDIDVDDGPLGGAAVHLFAMP